MIAVLVLVSAFLHAAWNAQVRREPDKDAAMVAVVAIAWLCTLGVVLIEALAGIALAPSSAGLGWAVAAGVGETGYFLALARALTAGPLAPTYTLARGGALIVVWPISIAVLGEGVDGLAIAGAVTVLVGLIVAGAERGLSRAAIGWGAACALCVAGYHLAYQRAVVTGSSEAVTFAIALALPVALNLARLDATRRAAVRGRIAEAPLTILATGALCAASFLILLVALRGGGAGAVLTLRNTSVLFATALAWAIGERPGRRAISGATLVAIGAIALGLAR
ncbi:MAG: permease [Deltaproteobacteria bacterium]|nr:permease [Deltaproteobacteria bacterium]